MRVCLDPGHDGSNPGAVGPTGLQEADVTLLLCRKIREKLQQNGHETVLTHDGDGSLPEDEFSNWKARAARANASLSDVYISVHCRTVDGDDLGGSAVYWPKGNAFGALLAQHIYERLTAMEGCNMLGIFSVENLYETRKAHMPAVLLEAATITNRSDETFLQNTDWVERFADSIATALGAWSEQAIKIMTPKEVSLTRQGRSENNETQTDEAQTNEAPTNETQPTSDTEPTPDSDLTVTAEPPATRPAHDATTADAPAATQPAPDTSVTTRAPGNVWVTPVMQVTPGRAAMPRMPKYGSSVNAKSHRMSVTPSIGANLAPTSPPQPAATAPASPTPAQTPGVGPAPGAIKPSGAKKQMLQGIKVSTFVQTPQGRVPVPGGGIQMPSTPK